MGGGFMKKYFAFILLFHLLFLSGCNKSMNYIIQNKPSVVGIVEKVYENFILIYCEQMDGYLTPAVRVDLEEGKTENSVKEWTTQEIADLFKVKADVDCTLIACASMYDFAYDRVGTILYTDSKEGYIYVAFMDKEGNQQHCGVEAMFRYDDKILFRGGVWDSEDFYWLYNEDDMLRDQINSIYRNVDE